MITDIQIHVTKYKLPTIGNDVDNDNGSGVVWIPIGYIFIFL